MGAGLGRPALWGSYRRGARGTGLTDRPVGWRGGVSRLRVAQSGARDHHARRLVGPLLLVHAPDRVRVPPEVVGRQAPGGR